MADKKTRTKAKDDKPADTTGKEPTTMKKTSLSIEPVVYRRAWNYKLDTGKDLGQIVSEALTEYLDGRGVK
jgi:hypothetical protein